MNLCVQASETSKQTAGMGQIVLGNNHDELEAVLGSCMGVALYDPTTKWGSLTHIVLPSSTGSDVQNPNKFADTAIPAAIRQLTAAGANRRCLVAKIAGGSSMFGGASKLKVGEANAEAVINALREAKIDVSEQDIGGDRGRRIRLKCETGQFDVEFVGKK